MKAKNNILFFLLVSLVTFSLVLSACDDDNADTTPPVINLIAPAEGGYLSIGSSIHFEVELSDDVMLSSYKVEIHDAFDGHGHGSTQAVRAEAETTAFTFLKTWEISGQRNTTIHHHEITIPEDATPGDYHLIVYCWDTSGNESYVARNIILTHEETGEEHAY